MGDGEGVFLQGGLDRSGFLLGAGALGALPHLVRTRPVAASARALARTGAGSLLLVVILLAFGLGLSDHVSRDALVVPELAIDPVLRQQLRMRAALDRPAACNDDDLV